MTSRLAIDIALQGGGAHGAFTWGVLDRLLADERLRIDGISGTSAGAMNAVVLADGFARGGGPAGARRALRSFWRAVSAISRFSPLQRSPLDRLFGNWSLDTSPGYLAMQLAGTLVSPYEINPLNINPLRDLLHRLVDFDRVRACGELNVFISATNVRTGKARIFRRDELDADKVMASACLPQIFQAVEIDGEAYWDGGYMGNPALFPLVDETDAHDLIIVQINPVVRDTLPRSAAEIMNRLNEITFNASLLREISSILLLKKLIDEEHVSRVRYTDMRLHRINADSELLNLSVSSKLNAEWKFLEYLYKAGVRVADAWLADNFSKLGRESTLDLTDISKPD
ncbi:MAG TPA: patatin-like phospholipase family protein [Noviherbaspirillum sp.]|uniref:patatin-like phospholipase family protein n=1 Tax=Noviherbaspirillum sp. TaxID=1926288 RepID=UPI002D2CC15F|nr:patatin-like phospholipase family protein [Noviherbaspirillum sp.]HYD96255.1 patatin-like phospholipase family protein [Noviherbaspirillum sp.]